MAGKRKLEHFAEMKTFPNVVEVGFKDAYQKKHPLAGSWRSEIFKNEGDLVLELGCGKAEYTLGLSRAYPNRNHIAVDVKGARMWRGAKTAIEERLSNAFFLRTRIEVIDSFFLENEVDEIWITFPDPQMRDSREKKRLTSPLFLDRYRNFLKPGGTVNLKTDSAFLYDYTDSLLKEMGIQANISSSKIYKELDRFDLDQKQKDILKIQTHYESMFTEKGHEICYIQFQLK